jgi:hypothetical protein
MPFDRLRVCASLRRGDASSPPDGRSRNCGKVAVARKKIKRLLLLSSSKATQPKVLVCETNKDLCCITVLLLLLYLSAKIDGVNPSLP